jgi:hypothetical protein
LQVQIREIGEVPYAVWQTSQIVVMQDDLGDTVCPEFGEQQQ